jgi:predicted nucleic acid-binding protein
MILDDLAAGDLVFVDANILIYHFSPHPTFGTSCQRLMQRIQNQELEALASTHVVAEVAHQLMIVEASNLPGWTPGKVQQRLRRHPAAVQSLSRFRTAVEILLQSRLKILPVVPSLLQPAAMLSQQHGLLTNDAICVALMQAQGITKVASADADFDRVPGIVRYAPG